MIALIVFPYLAIIAYMITQSRGMAERSSQQAQQAREELQRVVGFSVADEIEKLDRLKKSGAITDQEFTRLRAKLVGGDTKLLQVLVRQARENRSSMSLARKIASYFPRPRLHSQTTTSMMAPTISGGPYHLLVHRRCRG